MLQTFVRGAGMSARRSFTAMDHASRSVEYATVKGKILQRTDKAVLLSIGDSISKWIPLFRLETSSRIAVLGAAWDAEMPVQIQLQFALAEGLV